MESTTEKEKVIEMKETREMIVSIPEQGGSVLDVNLKNVEPSINLDFRPGSFDDNHHAALMMVIYQDGEEVGTVEVRKMMPEEAPDDANPYLIRVEDENEEQVFESVVDMVN